MHARFAFVLFQLLCCFDRVSAHLRGRELYAFDDGTFVENLAIRSNGHLIFGTFGRGRLYQINPKVSSPKLQLVAELPDVDSITGIAEVSPDVFALTAGTRTGPTEIESYKLFTVDFNTKRPRAKAATNIKLVANMTGVGLLNGMTALPGRRNTVLSADSRNGTIWSINVVNGRKEIAFTDQNFELLEDPAAAPIAVNGIHIFGSFLYFTNTARALLGRIPLTRQGQQAGPSEILARKPGAIAGLDSWDDFAIVPGSGNGPLVYVASNPDAIIQVQVESKKQTTFFRNDNSTVLYGPTSLAVTKDQKKMYVTTNGGEGPGGQVFEFTI